MHDCKEKTTFRAYKSWKKKNIFKYNLNITYLKNLILLIMQFFEKSGAIDR